MRSNTYIFELLGSRSMYKYSSGPRGHGRMVVGFTTTYAIQNLEPLNPAHGEVHPIQHYVMSVDVTCDRSVNVQFFSYIQDEPVFNIFFIQNVTIYIQIKVHPNCTETTKTKYDSACLTIL
jgi:hypothetical protein